MLQILAPHLPPELKVWTPRQSAHVHRQGVLCPYADDASVYNGMDKGFQGISQKTYTWAYTGC